MGLRAVDLGGELNPVDEFHTVDDFWQLVVAFKTAPTLLGALDQLEDHGEGGLVREASLGSGGPVPDCREGAFDWVCRSQVLPVMMWTASPQRHHSAKAWSPERHKEGDRP